MESIYISNMENQSVAIEEIFSKALRDKNRIVGDLRNKEKRNTLLERSQIHNALLSLPKDKATLYTELLRAREERAILIQTYEEKVNAVEQELATMSSRYKEECEAYEKVNKKRDALVLKCKGKR